MTTQTYTVNTIMAYVGADADVVGVSGLTVMPQWTGSKVYFLQTSNIFGPGIRAFDIDADGDETLQRSKASIGVTDITTASGGAACLTPDGTSLFFVSDAGNSVQLAKIRTSDLTLLATFGTAGNSTDPSTASRILQMHAMLATNSHLVCASEFTTQEVDTLGVSAFSTNTNNGALDTAGAGRTFGILIGPGGSNDAYLIGLPFANGSATTTLSLSIYKLTSGGTLTKIGSVAPADIDATWSHFSFVSGLAYDANDGHIIFGAQTTDSVTNKQYLLKVNTTTAAVVWTRAINYLNPYSVSFTFSRITSNHTFHYLDNSSVARHINTTNGAQTTETVTGLTHLGPQTSDDVTNSMILYADFIAGGSPPDYVGTYMDDGGHHNVSGWMRFWFATAAPSGDGLGDGGLAGGLALSNLRAWQYTQDAHTFYVLHLGPEGTFVYDMTTEQWSEFKTDGYTNWDVTNGVMWGSERVVGGDLVTTDLWELDPSTTDDQDGDLQIPHICMGELQTRSRDKIPVYEFNVTGSLGNLGNTAGSTARLRYSDDNGRTWSAYVDVTLTQGSNNEVVWRSLGAFLRPGRLFEISDSGGLVRIDGADADIGDNDQSG